MQQQETGEEGMIEAQWESFLTEVLSPNTPLIARRQLRRVFYAGAIGLLSKLSQLDEVTDETLRSLYREIHEFTKNVRNGGG